MKKFVALSVLLLVVAGAQAGLTYSIVQDTANPADDGMTAKLIYITGTSGSQMSAWDGTISGPCQQHWDAYRTNTKSAWSITKSIYVSDSYSDNNDSHYMFDAADVAVSIAPDELNSGSSSLPTGNVKGHYDVYGTGDLTHMAVGILSQTDSFLLARVVLTVVENYTNADCAHFTGQGAFGSQAADFDFYVPPTIPEPLTMSLLGLGAVGLIRRRS